MLASSYMELERREFLALALPGVKRITAQVYC
jgi:hypothetical protein